MNLARSALAAAVKAKALELGFQKVGVVRSALLPDTERRRMEEWLRRGFHAGMKYMEDAASRRCDPSTLLKNVRSIVCVAMNYYHRPPPSRYAVSMYAHGRDYHIVMEERLRLLAAAVDDLTGAKSAIAVDARPIAEKYWAERAGIGWRGKNANVIARDLGSWIFLGEILTEADLAEDPPAPDFCGTCRRCIDACPTKAIVEPGVVDSGRCISYLTIEHRGEIAESLKPLLGNHIFGCDICQEVCPWNRFAQPTSEPAFLPEQGPSSVDIESIPSLTDDEFRSRFRQSPLRRAKREGLARNIAIAGENIRSGTKG